MTDHLWETQVLNAPGASAFEGLVYRNSADPYAVKLARQKPRVQKLLRVTGFDEGKGKHEGRLGALRATDSDDSAGTPQRVGGGFSDSLREEIWESRADFLGRWFVAEGRKMFDSGSLRHPNFVEWHDA